MKRWKQALIMALGVSLGSQIYFNFFTDGFIVAMSPLLFSIFLYIFKELHPVKAGILTGIASPSFRGIMLFLSLHDFHLVWTMVWPDVIFFFSYGIFFYLFFYRLSHSYTRFFISIFLCDFLSNVMELTMRTGFPLFGEGIFKGLTVIAGVRTFVSLAIVISIDGYKSFLANQEHETRYKKLMVMASVFNAEVYFMKKNMVEIEDVMQKAFMLYRTVEKEGYPEEMRCLSLDIAKDVHEIKKDYIRVIKGLQDNFLADIDVKGMSIKDIVRILDMDIHEQIREHKLDIFFSFQIKAHFYVADHFSLMSVLRNLVINSMDAIGNQKKGRIFLFIREGTSADGDFSCGEDSSQGIPVYIFEISDNGPGIKEVDMDIIFDPGYSTKFDKQTGDISRGVGLTLVKDLIQDKFHGTIFVQSKEGAYTKFRIEIPKEMFIGEES
ncbi:MAG: ATP-binding protein [Anaerovorax sp.]|nr:ATP-binding protein [Anaerovorax sp.]